MVVRGESERFRSVENIGRVPGLTLTGNTKQMCAEGLDVGLSARHRLGLGYTGELGSNSRNHALTGQWQMSF